MFKTSKNYEIYPITLSKKVKETEDTYSFFFAKPEGLTWGEGAHTHLALDHFSDSIGWWEKKDIHHFTIASLPEEDLIQITTRIRALRSDYKAELFELKEGEPLYLFKIGNRMSLRRNNLPITLISAGVAIATLRPVVYKYAKDDHSIDDAYFINIDSTGHFVFADEMMQFEQNTPNLAVQYVERRDLFYNYLDERIRKLGEDKGYFYIVGSDEFITDVYHYLGKYNITREYIILDKKQEFYDSL